MLDLATPAPSSDVDMQGSSPAKQSMPSDTLKRLSTPFANLDLNTINERVKAFQLARQAAGETPPPSSPTPMGEAHLLSSPIPLPGSSPTKPTKTRPIDPLVQPKSLFCQQYDDASVPALDPSAGLEPNLEADGDLVPYVLYASYSYSLVIGRCKPSGMPHRSARQDLASPDSTKDQLLPMAGTISSSVYGLGTKNVMRINLPNQARHVSRVHAVIEWIPFVPSADNESFVRRPTVNAAGTFIVKIVGQNGLIVDSKRRREGQVIRLTPGKTTLDFFGVKCKFQVKNPPPERVVDQRNLSRPIVTSPLKRSSDAHASVSLPLPQVRQPLSNVTLPSSPPPTSPPGSNLDFTSSFGVNQTVGDTTLHLPGEDYHDDEDEDDDYGQQERAASPTPATRKSHVLKAGPEGRRRLRIGASEDEKEDEEEKEEEEEQDQNLNENDDDYLPEDINATKRRKISSKVNVGWVSANLLTPSSSRQPSPVPSSGKKRTASSSKILSRSSKENTPQRALDGKPVRRDDLTESQTQMPPPVGLSLSGSRRSASKSPVIPSVAVMNPMSVQEMQDQARLCVRLLAPTYDLPGLLAGAIVFHRTATISASEAVRSVLSSTPGLLKGEAGEQMVAYSPSKRRLAGSCSLKHGCVVEGWPVESGVNEKWNSISRKAWREHLEVVLQSLPMFGVIHRAGKDASGNPLECWYYYDKEQDSDKERAENLGAFAKPMRKVLKGQKPIFWKKSAYATRHDDYEVRMAAIAKEEKQLGQETLDVATAPLPKSVIPGLKRKKLDQSRKNDLTNNVASQQQQQQQQTAPVENEEKKREKLRAKIAKSGLWDETQPEEREEPTWDRVGDLDWKKGTTTNSK